MGMNNLDLDKNYIKYVLIGLLALIFCIIVIIVALFVVANNAGLAYALLIDAGSTSSKLFIFGWKDWPFIDNGYVQELGAEKVSPGISNYKNNPDEAYTKLEPKIKSLTGQYIPSAVRSRSHQFLAATAGMRLLSLENPLKSDAIIESLQLNLPRDGLKLGNSYSDVRIMSGRDEGIYAFITVNYLLGNFGDRQTLPVDRLKTVGSLDLGGASTQIAFVPEGNQNAPHTSTRRLFGNEYPLYSYSYLCYGKSAAETRVWAEIIVEQFKTNQTTIDNPCLHNGKQITFKVSEVFDNQCVTGRYSADLVGPVLQKPKDIPDEVTFKGTGDRTKCRAFVMKMFPDKQCNYSSCMHGGVYRPPLRGNFYAFSGFTYSAKFFGILFQTITRDYYIKLVEDFCKKNYKDVQAMPGYDRFTYIFCFDGVYIEALLAAYGFNTSDSWKSITFADKINKASVSWAMGYTIDATGMIESASPQIRLEVQAFIATVVILSIVFIILLVALLLIILRK